MPSKSLRLVAMAALVSVSGCRCEGPKRADAGVSDAGDDGGASDSGTVGLDAGAMDSGFDAGHDAGITLEAACLLLGEGLCTQRVRCGRMASADQPGCVAARAKSCTRRLRLVALGGLRFDWDAATACLNDFVSASCGAHNSEGHGNDNGDSICPQAFKPAGMPGAPCDYGTCLSGYCPATDGQACTACVAYAALGTPCMAFNSCDPATGWCPYAPTDGGAQLCQPQLDAGAVYDIETNSGSNVCKDNGALVVLADGGYRCGPLGQGQPCHSPSDCGERGFCLGLRIDQGGNVTLAGNCQPRMATGTPCHNEQLDDGCADGGTCLGSVCAVLTGATRTLNQECDMAFGQCAGDAWCQGADLTLPDGGAGLREGRCVPLGGPDAGCTPFSIDSCGAGLACSAQSSRCVPLAGPMEPCGFGAPCLERLSCSNHASPHGSRCLRGLALGEACDRYSTTCADGYCRTDGGQVTEGTCVVRLGLDAPCDTSDQCQSDRCLSPDGGAQQLCAAPCFP